MQVGGATATAGITQGPSKPKEDAVKTFLDFMHMSQAEKMQTLWLARHGIKKEEFDKMEPEKRQKLLEQMAQEMKQRVEDEAKKALSPDSMLG